MIAFLFNVLIRDPFAGCKKADWWFDHPRPPKPYWKDGKRVPSR